MLINVSRTFRILSPSTNPLSQSHCTSTPVLHSLRCCDSLQYVILTVVIRVPTFGFVPYHPRTFSTRNTPYRRLRSHSDTAHGRSTSDVTLFPDEVYRALTYRPHGFVSASCAVPKSHYGEANHQPRLALHADINSGPGETHLLQLLPELTYQVTPSLHGMDLDCIVQDNSSRFVLFPIRYANVSTSTRVAVPALILPLDSFGIGTSSLSDPSGPLKISIYPATLQIGPWLSRLRSDIFYPSSSPSSCHRTAS